MIFRDTLETVKKGDTLQIAGNKNLCTNSIEQGVRLVKEVVASDVVDTNAYTGIGINGDPNCKRPVTWCKQGSDKIINGQVVSKSREELEALIQPTTLLIQPVGLGSTVAYVENVTTVFNPLNEDQTDTKTKQIALISQDSIRGAIATATVGSSGTITSISVTDGGVGYTTTPVVIVGNPVGLGTTQRAQAIAGVSIGGSIFSISVTEAGTGYTSTNPPEVLIEVPSASREVTKADSYAGDFGQVVGFGTTTVGSFNRFIFDLHIPGDSYLKNTSIVSTAVTVSGISTGDYFVVNNSNIGSGNTAITSYDIGGDPIGVGTVFVNNVYQVADFAVVSVAKTSIGIATVGTAMTDIKRVFALVDKFSGDTFSSLEIKFDSTGYTFDAGGGNYTTFSGGISTESHMGDYSWGKIELGSRSNPQSFNFYGNRGVTGISTSAIVRRVAPLKSKNYS